MPLNVSKPETSNITEASNSVSFQFEQDNANQVLLPQNDEVVHVVDFDTIKKSGTDCRRSKLSKMNRISEEKMDDVKWISSSSFDDK